MLCLNCLFFKEFCHFTSPFFFKVFSADTNGVIRSRKLKKDRQHNCQKKKAKRTNIDKQTTTLKLKIEEHESQQKSRMNSGAAEGKAMPAQL
jgi:hypothetical protein